MPRVNIPIQTLPSYGGVNDAISWTSGDAANDHEYLNDGNTILLCDNTHASSSFAVTIVSVADPFNRTGDLTVTLSADETGIVGPLPPEAFNQTGGLVQVNINDNSIRFAAFRIPKR